METDGEEAAQAVVDGSQAEPEKPAGLYPGSDAMRMPGTICSLEDAIGVWRTMAQQHREWGAVRELLPVFNSSSSGFLVRLSYNVNTSELVKRFSEQILL